ncbi:Lrp/AsnC family transcriptional regulator [Cryptosporangium sp. NPDC051539]|uniref:Lrp/AsnC family transcriptional regulator n=1 Tax=Cryptosporangium sp. NPDC051539 TaxID=3363962 RepID=UPI00379FF6BD
MDDIDSAILAHLQRDARQTNRELAAAVGLAPSTCLERVRALRAAGVLTGFHAAVDLAAMNRRVQALISVQVRPLSREVIQSFKSYTAALPEVLSVYVVTGQHDILLHVAVPHVDAMHTFLMDRITVRREVIGFNTSVIYQHTRNAVVSPLP